VKLVMRVELLPTPEQAAALGATLHACNEAANHVSAIAHATGIKKNRALRAETYTHIKNHWGLGAQAAQHVIKRTCDAYEALKSNIKDGNLGRPGSKRRTAATGRPITFRPDAAPTYDDRMLSWQMTQRTVSIWTTKGRLKHLPFTGDGHQLQLLAQYRQGESDLLCQGGRWYLLATLDVPEAPQNPHPHGKEARRTRDNRPSQAVFTCCGFVEHADLNASHTISRRGWWMWVRGAESQAPAVTLVV
jgi:hypothetical protein